VSDAVVGERVDRPWRPAAGALAPLGLAAVGIAAALVAVLADRSGAQSAASQVWAPFVLVAGLLVVGLAADQDGLSPRRPPLAALAPNGFLLFAGAAVTVAVVTALLNLDTSVVFLTPCWSTRRGPGQSDVALLVGCLLLSNAGSLLLPGSNLTNLIVLGTSTCPEGSSSVGWPCPGWGRYWSPGGHRRGRAPVTRLPGRRRTAVHAAGGPAVSGVREVARPLLSPSGADPRPRVVAVAVVTVLVLVLKSPAIPVAGSA